VEFHLGKSFPPVGFIVSNLETDSRAVVRFYNQRGTAEQWGKEGKQADFAATPGEDRRQVGQARAVLLAPAGGESFDAAAFRGDGAAGRLAPAAGGIAGASEAGKLGERRDRGRRGV